MRLNYSTEETADYKENIAIKFYLWIWNHTKIYKESMYKIQLNRWKNIEHSALNQKVLWHINHCRLFSTKSCLFIYIKYR